MSAAVAAAESAIATLVSRRPSRPRPGTDAWRASPARSSALGLWPIGSIGASSSPPQPASRATAAAVTRAAVERWDITLEVNRSRPCGEARGRTAMLCSGGLTRPGNRLTAGSRSYPSPPTSGGADRILARHSAPRFLDGIVDGLEGRPTISVHLRGLSRGNPPRRQTQERIVDLNSCPLGLLSLGCTTETVARHMSSQRANRESRHHPDHYRVEERQIHLVELALQSALTHAGGTIVQERDRNVRSSNRT